MNTLFRTLITLAVATSGGLALAHGDAAHAKKDMPMKVEQKPWGVAGNPKSVTRTIAVSMTDTMRFSPEKIEVKQGDTLKFVLKNDGKAMHDELLRQSATQAKGGIIRPNLDPHSRPQWPEAFWLLTHKTRLSYTLEAPSDFPLNVRINALVNGVNAALACRLLPSL